MKSTVYANFLRNILLVIVRIVLSLWNNFVFFVRVALRNTFFMQPTSQLPFLPLSLHTLAEAPFFVSSHPGVVRAGFYMLETAWRSSRPGSIGSSFSELANITRLTVEEVDQHYTVLTTGWDFLEDGRLHHAQLEAICDSIRDRFGDQLSVLADSAVAAMQGGEMPFDLMPSTEVVKKKRGKHLLPKDFVMNKATLAHALGEGFKSPEYQGWLMQTFSDYALANSVMKNDWQATCRQFITSDITRKQFRSRFHHFPGDPAPSLGLTQSTQDRLKLAASNPSRSFAEQMLESNVSRMRSPNRFTAQPTPAATPAPAVTPAANRPSTPVKRPFGHDCFDIADADFVMQDHPDQGMCA